MASKLLVGIAALILSLPLGVVVATSAQPAAATCTIPVTDAPLPDLDREQAGNAQLIVAVGEQRRVPELGLLAALMTAMMESGLRNLTYGDRDSLGLFQQRPSLGWGTASQIHRPSYAAAAFFGGPSRPDPNPGLLDVPGWERLPAALAAQAVQRSDSAAAYARWESPARGWLSATLAAAQEPAPSCPSATGLATVVLSSAARWLGTPYSWGGGNADGPTLGIAQGAGTVGFDCSGLTLYAYAQAGITLPRTAAQQWEVQGQRVGSLAELRAGDLVFFATDPSDPATIHHVALALGGDAMLEAPRTGDVVRITPAVSESTYWAPQFIGGLRLLP